MWERLPITDKEEYRRLILAFASLTEAFTQKADVDSSDIVAPFINSKYQETVFQKAFNASAEDIGNTSFDAALALPVDNDVYKYLVGLKTFGISSGDQKIAQFKANRDDWSALTEQMVQNARDEQGHVLAKDEINQINDTLYKEMATRVARLRNTRIDSSIANLRGFRIDGNEHIESVYHVLMPSKKGDDPKIYVGETSYNKIDEENIVVEGCTSPNNPSNFLFSDGIHRYKYTAADCQLHMNFENADIVKETWDVIYAEDPYQFFYNLANKVYEEAEYFPTITEEYYWPILNSNNEVEKYSGFNGFYGLGSKLSMDARERVVAQIRECFAEKVPESLLELVTDRLLVFLTVAAPKRRDKERKELLRLSIHELLNIADNKELSETVLKYLYRPKNEMYIPIPNARTFHKEHPDFFRKGAGELDNNFHLVKTKEQRKFNLVFEPSGDVIEAFITQDNGKAIESFEKQSILGEWILREIFQLDEYEPVSAKKLQDVGINTVHIYKTNQSEDVHIEFVWVDKTEEQIKPR